MWLLQEPLERWVDSGSALLSRDALGETCELEILV